MPKVGVLNGKCEIILQDINFMTINDVKECILSLKNKRCEGFDRLLVSILCDANNDPVIAGLIYDITCVMMMGPKKTFKHLKKL